MHHTMSGDWPLFQIVACFIMEEDSFAADTSALM